MEIKKQEDRSKVYILLEDQTFLEITEYTSGPPYNLNVDKITILHNRNEGPNFGFEYDPRTGKLSEVSASG